MLKGRGPADLDGGVGASWPRACWCSAGVARRSGGRRRRRCATRIASGAGLERFREIIEHQGGDPRVVDDYGRLPTAPTAHVVTRRRARLRDARSTRNWSAARRSRSAPAATGSRIRSIRRSASSSCAQAGRRRCAPATPIARAALSRSRRRLGRAARSQPVGMRSRPIDDIARTGERLRRRRSAFLASLVATQAVVVMTRRQLSSQPLPVRRRVRAVIVARRILAIAYCCRRTAARSTGRTVAWGLGLQIVFALDRAEDRRRPARVRDARRRHQPAAGLRRRRRRRSCSARSATARCGAADHDRRARPRGRAVRA